MIKHLPINLLLVLLFISSGISGQGLFEGSFTGSDSAATKDPEFGGFIRSGLYTGFDKNSDVVDLQSLYGQFGLSSLISAGKFGNAYAEARFRSGTEFGERFADMELREAFVNLFLGPVTITAGKQIITWGSAAMINPTDRFSPVDPTIRSPEPDDMHMGCWALQSSFSINASSRITVLWLPLYEPSRLLTTSSIFPGYLRINEVSHPIALLKNSSIGFRYDLTSRLLDFDLSYYNGYRNDPSLVFDTALFDMQKFSLLSLGLNRIPVRIRTAGINLTVPLGRTLVRTEAAWMDPVNKDQGFGIPDREIAFAAEIEQTGSNVTLIAGYYGKYIPGFEEKSYTAEGVSTPLDDPISILPAGVQPDPDLIHAEIAERVEAFNRLYTYQLKQFYHAAYALLTVSLIHDLVTVDIPCMYTVTTRELMLMPAAGFKITDGLTCKLGVTCLAGKKSSLYDLAGTALNAGFFLLQMKF